MARRIGLFGGTFDPIHVAHLVVAEWARVDLRLDIIFFIPNRIPPHKTPMQPCKPEDRRAMLNLAIADNPHFAVCTVELERDGPSYTVETLRLLRQDAQFAGADLFWIVGADNLVEFRQWREPQEIQNLCVLVVYPRLGVRLDRAQREYIERTIILKAPILEVASTDIRRRLLAGCSVRYLVPDPVIAYIENHGLYLKKSSSNAGKANSAT